MASKRARPSKSRKDSLRFVLIPPKPTRLLEFSDRMYRKDARATVAGVRRDAASEPNLSFSRRVAAALIAAVWICAGGAAAAYGVREGAWVPGVAGPVLLLYGIAWFRVAHRGRSAGGRLRLKPWRTE